MVKNLKAFKVCYIFLASFFISLFCFSQDVSVFYPSPSVKDEEVKKQEEAKKAEEVRKKKALVKDLANQIKKNDFGFIYACQAARENNLDLSKCYFIGDDIRDLEAGEAAGCKTMLVDSTLPLLRIVREKILND